MNARTLLHHLRSREVLLESDGDRLIVDAPAGVVTEELRTALTEHKQEIIRIMREDEEMRRTGIIQSERQVFDLAQEFFGGQNGKGAA